MNVPTVRSAPVSPVSLSAVIQAATAEGVLPAGTQATAADARPWPVVLLIALGAWLAALPLLGAVGLLLDDAIERGPVLYIVAGLLLASAVVVLRSAALPLFVEQLAVPALLVGASSLGFCLLRDL
ncbi:MAG TPA: DUF4401 domain-containing protein, partial [Rubrivivax sp.]|nr:DUF4401 domain-containing protein [Rubrivivax sp.]